MQFTRLGHTGLTVSRLCLGCMTYGVPERGAHPWTLNEAMSRPLIRQAVELGINFFDTANLYSDGTSEEIVGRALRDFARRDEIVVATKVRFGSRKAPNIGGLSRKAIFAEIDASLQRLLYREEEREMLPLCIDQGVGVIPWSPLARGRLARPWGDHTPRIASDVFGATLFEQTEENDRQVALALAGVAAQSGATRASVALAWLLRKPGITAPIVGASKPEHFDDALAALKLELSAAQVAALEAPYLPHAVVGFE